MWSNDQIENVCTIGSSWSVLTVWNRRWEASDFPYEAEWQEEIAKFVEESQFRAWLWLVDAGYCFGLTTIRDVIQLKFEGRRPASSDKKLTMCQLQWMLADRLVLASHGQWGNVSEHCWSLRASLNLTLSGTDTLYWLMVPAARLGFESDVCDVAILLLASSALNTLWRIPLQRGPRFTSMPAIGDNNTMAASGIRWRNGGRWPLAACCGQPAWKDSCIAKHHRLTTDDFLDDFVHYFE